MIVYKNNAKRNGMKRYRKGKSTGNPSKRWMRTVFWSVVGGFVLMAIAPGLRKWVMTQTAKAGIAA